MIISALEKAFAEAAKLSEQEQDALAARILEELLNGGGKRPLPIPLTCWLSSLVRHWLNIVKAKPKCLIQTSNEISHNSTLPQSVQGFTQASPASSPRIENERM